MGDFKGRFCFYNFLFFLLTLFVFFLSAFISFLFLLFACLVFFVCYSYLNCSSFLSEGYYIPFSLFRRSLISISGSDVLLPISEAFSIWVSITFFVSVFEFPLYVCLYWSVSLLRILISMEHQFVYF